MVRLCQLCQLYSQFRLVHVHVNWIEPTINCKDWCMWFYEAEKSYLHSTLLTEPLYVVWLRFLSKSSRKYLAYVILHGFEQPLDSIGLQLTGGRHQVDKAWYCIITYKISSLTRSKQSTTHTHNISCTYIYMYVYWAWGSLLQKQKLWIAYMYN